VNKAVAYWSTIAGLLISFYSQASAQTPFTGGFYPAGKQNSLEGALSMFYYDYGEDLPSPAKSTEKGWIPGFHLALSHQGTNLGLFARAGTDYSSANTTYDGSVIDLNTMIITPYIGTTHNTMLNAFGNLGITVMSLPSPPRSFSAYTGIGYRFWHRQVAGGYRENYAWKYLPVGLRMDYQANSGISGAVDASARFMFGGTIKVFYSDIDPSVRDFSLTLGNRPGWRVEAPVYYQNWSLIPWYEYSAIGRSNTVTLFTNGNYYDVDEPSSTTHQFGLKVGLRTEF
jgi:hypothetical protein